MLSNNTQHYFNNTNVSALQKNVKNVNMLQQKVTSSYHLEFLNEN